MLSQELAHLERAVDGADAAPSPDASTAYARLSGELKTTLTVFPPAPPNAPSWARRPGTDVRGGWQLAMVPHVGSIGLIDGLRFYVVKDWLVAWNMPNRGGNSPFRGDGPKALSTNEMLSRMAKGGYLRVHDQPLAFRYIPLAGFSAAVKDMHACWDAIAGD